MIDFNNAEQQKEFGLIPENTFAKAKLILKPGDHATDQYLTNSKNSDSDYLNCEFVILEGRYAKRKIFHKIGVQGSDKWINSGKAMIRAILESAKNINSKDMSQTAIEARKINSFGELNGLDVIIKIGVEIDKTGVYSDKNRIVAVITPDNAAYKEYMSPAVSSAWGL